MNHAINCKFCKKPITVEIDNAYAELGDPYKLLSLACCNHCADLRVERRRLTEKIARICRKVELCRSEDSRAEFRVVLEKLTQRYANLIARFHDKERMAWDEAVVDTLMDNPKEWGSVVSQMWKHYRETKTLS